MWGAIFISFLSFLGIGFWGYEALDAGGEALWFNNLYEAIKLFVIGGNFEKTAALNAQLQIARFGAPAITVIAFLQIAAESIYRYWSHLVIKIFRRHVVLCGEGRMSAIILDSLVSAGERVVIVGPRQAKQVSPVMASRSIISVDGDPRNVDVLKAAGAGRARYIIAAADDDGFNVEVGLAARELQRGNRHSPLVGLIHLADTTLSHRLKRYQKFVLTTESFEPRLFSLHENSARMLLHEYPPDLQADLFQVARPHFVIAGFGQGGRQVAVEIGRICHYSPARLPRITVLDREALQRQREFLTVYPEFDLCADISFAEIDFDLSELGSCDLLMSALAEDPVTGYVVRCNDDEESLSVALKFRQFSLAGKSRNAPVFVGMRDRSGLAQLIGSHGNMSETPDGLFPFGMVQDCLSFSNLLNQELDETAKAVHQQFRSDSGHSSAADSAWDSLDLQYRDSNRQAADHLDAKLRSVRSHRVPLPTSAAPWKWTREEVERLSEIEHRRWCADRRIFGWRQDALNTPPERFDPGFVHTDLVPWSDLPERTRQQTRDQLEQSVPGALARVDCGIARDFVIGLAPDWHSVVHEGESGFSDAQVRDKLKEIACQAKGDYVILMTALASTFERQVAKVASEPGGPVLEVVVILPLPFELYSDDITANGGEAAIEAFRTMIGKATRYHEAPLRFGSLHDMKPGSRAREEQYAQTSAHIAARSDVLFRQETAGEGAGDELTARLLQWWATGSVPAEFVGDVMWFTPPRLHEECIMVNPS